MTGPQAGDVFVVDDDDELREALVLLLDAAGLRCHGFGSARAFLDAYEGRAYEGRVYNDQPGCLILDVSLPGLDGLQLQRLLAEKHIDLPIVFLTGQATVPQSVAAIKAGADDFLEKPVDYEKLLRCVRTALDKGTKRHQAQARFERLTPREREVMDQVIAGNTSKEIARDLGISHRTVEAHRFRLMEKLRADSLPTLIAMARDAGLLGEAGDEPHGGLSETS